MPNHTDQIPLGVVRTFAIAARFQNFKRAAAELGVTPTAVSSQVKTLEGFLGCALFERNAQSVTLTEAGRQFSEACDGIFNRLNKAVQDTRRVASRASITVGAGR